LEKYVNIPLDKGGQGGFIPYRDDLKEKSRNLRKEMTQAEKKLWYNFLNTLNLPILRQKPLLDYIVDFYISSL
jgi:very-short-patch-repair endonuclease